MFPSGLLLKERPSSRHGDMWKIQFRWFLSKRCVTVNFMVFRRQNSKYYMPDLLNWLILEDDCSEAAVLGLESWMITGGSPG